MYNLALFNTALFAISFDLNHLLRNGLQPISINVSCIFSFHVVILTFVIRCIVIAFHLIAIFANYFNP